MLAELQNPNVISPEVKELLKRARARIKSELKVRQDVQKQKSAEDIRVKLLKKNIASGRLKCKTLAGFIREAWPLLEPVAVYVHNWHIDEICRHLEAITNGTFLAMGLENRLLINVPPGSMKSLIVSVFWPAWEWSIGKSSLRYITTSFKEDACKRDAGKMRDLITSEWYQTLFPHIVLDRKGEKAFTNTATGRREGSPFGSLTSKRGDRLIIDDPHSIDTAESEGDRNKTTRRFREGALNRLNDQKRSAIVVIMQRLHELDMSGVIIAQKMRYIHLMLPMEFEPERACSTVLGLVDPRTKKGELLDPVRFPPETVAFMTTDMGSHAYAGQYQQRPSAREGGQFKRIWFKIVGAKPDEYNRGVRRWDLAATAEQPGKDPDYTACVRMWTNGRRFVIDDVQRMRVSAHKVRVALTTTAGQDGRRVVIVIPQDPGQAGKEQAASIIGELAGFRAYAERETDAKDIRGEAFAAQCEAGNVDLVEGPWNESFISEMCGFPQGHDDQYDAGCGAFNYLAKKKPLVIPDAALKNTAQAGRRK